MTPAEWAGIIIAGLTLIGGVIWAVLKGFWAVRDLIDEKYTDTLKKMAVDNVTHNKEYAEILLRIADDNEHNNKEHAEINGKLIRHASALDKLCKWKDNSGKRLRQVEQYILKQGQK